MTRAAPSRAVGRQTGSGTKLASIVAGRIVADIAAAGWPAGDVIGSESELLERYGVSRAVFREAVRLLEHQQVGRMRRGPGGGLVVTEPSIDSAMDPVMVYLLYIRAEPAEVFEARLALEESAAQLASERLTEDGIARLRELAKREAAGEVANHRGLHALVASVTANPALEFFVDVLNPVTLLYTPASGAITRQVLAVSSDAHVKIIESVIGGNGSQAAHRMRRHLEAEADFMQKQLPGYPRLDEVFAPDGGAKLAESIARQLFAEVTASGWEVGQALGSEPELIRRFGISRAVLRETVGVLEHHQIARMRRGPGGGLFVAEPGVDATTAAVALHLDRHKIEAPHLFEVRGIIEMTRRHPGSTPFGNAMMMISPCSSPAPRRALATWCARPASSPKVSVFPDGDAAFPSTHAPRLGAGSEQPAVATPDHEGGEVEVVRGGIPLHFWSERAGDVWGDAIAAGAAKRDPELGPLEIVAGGNLAITDDYEQLREQARPTLTMYFGGMCPREDFYNDLLRRYGFEEEAELTQDAYLGGRRKEAAAEVPRELIDGTSLVGPAGWVKERVAAFDEAGVTVLNVSPVGPNALADLEKVRSWLD